MLGQSSLTRRFVWFVQATRRYVSNLAGFGKSVRIPGVGYFSGDPCLKSTPASTPSYLGAPKLLRVSGLRVTYASPGHARVGALRDVSFETAAGEIVGILGESGCGKSTLAQSILCLLPASARLEGSIFFHEEDLPHLNGSQLRAIRGARISLIHQEPGLALSPGDAGGRPDCRSHSCGR